MTNKIFLLGLFLTVSMQLVAQKQKLIIGTYTNTFCPSDGIYLYDFDEKTSEIELITQTKKMINPSFLSWNSAQNKIYSVNEDGINSKISTLEFDSINQDFKLINQQKSSADPCYILYENNKVYVANYSGGSVAVYNTDENGVMTNLEQELFFDNASHVREDRQEKSHIHQLQFSVDKKHLIATDLGADLLYIFDVAQDNLPHLSNQKIIKINAGSGPRHLVFDAKGEFVFLVGELDGKIYSYKFSDGDLILQNEISILGKDVKDNFRVAEIRISDDNRFLYVSNRDGKTNDLTVLKIKKNGKLTFVQQLKTLGENPRNFQFSPNQKQILVANQDSNEIVVFNRNARSGKLSNTDVKLKVCAPVYVGFLEKN